MPEERVLITGASGKIGQLLCERIKDRYALILTDKRDPAEKHGFPFIQSDISDYDSVNQVFQEHPGVDTVIHLAADIRITAPWESLLPNNIVGLYNVFEAAYQAGVKRVIFASSINAVDGYAKGIQVHRSMPVAPANLYGASKAWGEAVGRLYADTKGMAVHCLRIGWLTPHDGERLHDSTPNSLVHMTITHRDLMRFFDACLASELHFGIWHVLSDNLYKRLDISDTRAALGYEPQDDGYQLSGKIPDPENF